MSLPLHRLALRRPTDPPCAVGTFDSIGPLARADFPHRHTFYELALITGGTGRHLLELAAYPLDPPQLAVILPGRVHHWHAERMDGWVVLFADEFLAGRPGDRELLHALGERPWLRLDPGTASELAGIAGAMRRECDRPAAGTAGVLQAYLHILLVRAWRLVRVELPVAGAGRAAVLTQRFLGLAAQGRRRSVRECAAVLGVSPGYLGEAVREAAGQSPAQLLRQARVAEARRLLGGTRLTVAQVGRELGFADPAYFCRFFLRETGRTPGDFRRAATPPALAPDTPPRRRKHHDPVAASIDVPRSPS